MAGETVDENKEPISKKKYWGKKSVFGAYNTDYLAEGIPKSQEVFFEAFKLNFKQRFLVLLYIHTKFAMKCLNSVKSLIGLFSNRSRSGS